jgi:hypothetical protein
VIFFSGEEQIIEALFRAGNEDTHPDAHACKLKLWMVSSDSIMADFMPWDIRLEYEMYVQKNAHVSAGMLNTERACHHALLIL